MQHQTRATTCRHVWSAWTSAALLALRMTPTTQTQLKSLHRGCVLTRSAAPLRQHPIRTRLITAIVTATMRAKMQVRKANDQCSPQRARRGGPLRECGGERKRKRFALTLQSRRSTKIKAGFAEDVIKMIMQVGLELDGRGLEVLFEDGPWMTSATPSRH